MSKCIVPKDIVRGDLGPDYKAMYITLWMRSKQSKVEGITRKQLGSILGFHEDKVSKIIGGLKDKGLVLIVRQGRKGNKYILPRKKIFQTKPGNYTLIERRVFLNPRIPVKARLIHATINSFQYGKKVSKLSHDYLSSLLGFSTRSVSRYLLLLRKMGLVNMYRRKYLSNMYHVSNEYKHFQYKPAKFLGDTERRGDRHNSVNHLTQLEQDSRFERLWEAAYEDLYDD